MLYPSAYEMFRDVSPDVLTTDYLYKNSESNMKTKFLGSVDVLKGCSKTLYKEAKGYMDILNNYGHHLSDSKLARFVWEHKKPIAIVTLLTATGAILGYKFLGDSFINLAATRGIGYDISTISLGPNEFSAQIKFINSILHPFSQGILYHVKDGIVKLPVEYAGRNASEFLNFWVEKNINEPWLRFLGGLGGTVAANLAGAIVYIVKRLKGGK